MGVEIDFHPRTVPGGRSCPARGMGVEIPMRLEANTSTMSCPARGMGVEIYLPAAGLCGE